MDDRHARHRRRRADPRRRPLDGFRTPDLARFTRLVATALAELPPELSDRADRVDVVVRDVPPTDEDPVPFAALVPGSGGQQRLEVYRRPIESRAQSRNELAIILADVIAEELEEL